MTSRIAREPLAPVAQYPPDLVTHYRERGYWTDETLAGFITAAAARHPDNEAVVGSDASGTQTRLTYSDLDRRSSAVAGGLSGLGVRAGDRVLLQLPNIVEYVEALFGVLKLGALPVFGLPAHRRTEIGYFCQFADVAAYIVADRHGGFDYRALAREVNEGLETPPVVIVAGDPEEFVGFDSLRGYEVPVLADVDPLSVAFLQLSGGTTGVPKLIPRTHADYLYSVRASNPICGVDDSTRMLVVLPAAHNFPMSSPGILGVFHAGGTVVLAPDTMPSTAFGLIESERVTHASLVPPIALAWMAAPSKADHDLSSLRVLGVGGAKFSAEAAARVPKELGCTLQQVFGMAEGLVNYTRLDDTQELIVSTQGRPISPDDEVRVVDDEGALVAPGTTGHLLTRGPYTIRGYYRADAHNAEVFDAEGFYRTGDLVSVTDSGHLIVEGRAKDQINRGGEKVAAEEIENHLLSHPAVHDAAVVAVPDEYLGERTCAVLVISGDAPTVGEIKRYIRGRGVAAYKVPDRVEFVTEFPVTGVGKTSKAALRRVLSESIAAQTLSS
ncbi:(2,3-dihydroxybenzoyl)adenylate synthase [Rhodococcus erythropolis]|uniref:(2,3-dihydroxybenzoyl)adenylate synthase n=1 Tax=Rhodococcus qingshengii TaxID=334542 RepID=UPI0001A32D32|nr:(2,3-dihydroxybenzoyl)adenylate synthase [Rhodococcus erythropolis SK121]